jgi:hypothetical protein
VGWQERYSGTYRINGVDVRIYGAGDSLMAHAPGQAESRLIHQQGHEFTLATEPQTRFEFEMEGSRARAVVVVARNRRVRGERIR